MDRAELAKRLMATFLDELEEHVRAMSRDLLALEREGRGRGEARSSRACFERRTA